MIRSIVALLVIVLGTTAAVLPSAARADGDATPKTDISAVTKYAWIWSGKDGTASPPFTRPIVPVAACTAECCCQVFAGGSMTHQCKSRSDCIDAGGLCRPKTDAKCN